VSYSPAEAISKSHLTDEFDCGSEAQTSWLRRHALQADLTDSTKVRVVTRSGERRVVGYYALSAGSVELADAPERVRKGMPRYPVPVIILTRLGVDRSEQGKGLGRALVDAILRPAAPPIGTALLIHCETIEARTYRGWPRLRGVADRPPTAPSWRHSGRSWPRISAPRRQRQRAGPGGRAIAKPTAASCG
jgi:GNAT superfamily N-acetyltransferase